MQDDEEEGAELPTQYELQISIEPSLEAGGKPGSQGMSAVLSVVREKPAPLQVCVCVSCELGFKLGCEDGLYACNWRSVSCHTELPRNLCC